MNVLHYPGTHISLSYALQLVIRCEKLGINWQLAYSCGQFHVKINSLDVLQMLDPFVGCFFSCYSST
jgi:hypothetical protein